MRNFLVVKFHLKSNLVPLISNFPPTLVPTYNSDDIVVAVVIPPLQQTVDHLDDVVLRAPVTVVVAAATDFAVFAAEKE